MQQLVALTDYILRAAVRTDVPDLFDQLVDTYCIPDITGATDWSQVLMSCDVVIHTAARVHIMEENSCNPLDEFRRVNVEGTLNLARHAVKQGVKRFIFISSIGVNGESTSDQRPFKPDDLPKPDSAYAISKYEAEQGLLALASETGLEVVIIRPPLVYGPGAKGNFQRMMKLISSGIPLPLGRVNNQRSFVYVGNLVCLIMRCVEHPQAANQVFLVSDGDDLSTTELLHKIGSSLEKPARLLPIPYRILGLSATLLGKKAIFQRLCGSLQVDISKTCELLDWQPIVKPDEALRITAEDYLRK